MQIETGVLKSQELEGESLKGWEFKVSLGYKRLWQKKKKIKMLKG